MPGQSTKVVGGNTSCIEVRYNSSILVLDAGTGIRALGLALQSENSEAPIDLTVLITHTHWDHIQGFPYFRPAYQKSNHIDIIGFEGACGGLHQTLAGQMESPYFPVAMAQMPSSVTIAERDDLNFTVRGAEVKACRANHPGGAFGYRITYANRSIAYMPDHEIDSPEPVISRQEIVAWLRGVDVAILDSQYTQDEYASHRGWGHSSIDQTIQLAVEAGVKKLVLFHHDPNHDDLEMLQIEAQAVELAKRLSPTLKVEIAKEGDSFLVN